MDRVQDIVKELGNLTVLQVADLVKRLEEEWGVSAAAPVAVAPAAASVAAEEVAEESNEFNVILKETGSNRIQVIKTIREICGLGLKEASEAANQSDFVLKTGIAKAAAEEVKKKFEEAGAKIDIKAV